MTVYESTAPRGGGMTVAAALIALVTVVGVFMRPLLAIDETRYAAVAVEMLQRGGWLVPHRLRGTFGFETSTKSRRPPNGCSSPSTDSSATRTGCGSI